MLIVDDWTAKSLNQREWNHMVRGSWIESFSSHPRDAADEAAGWAPLYAFMSWAIEENIIVNEMLFQCWFDTDLESG